jgi:hypothetical protein
MKSGLVFLPVILLFAALPVPCCAALDELDELLNTPPAVADRSSSSFLELDYSQQAEDQQSDRYDGRRWQPAAHPSATETAASHRASLQDEPRSQEGKELAPAVPEPSAWLLAGAALLYLLVFGRRRRTI